MEFGLVPVLSAGGGILAHSLRVDGSMFRKGRVLSASDVDALARAGFAEVTIARLSASDVSENEAAERIARAVARENVRVGAAFTGRANLYAQAKGLARVAPEVIGVLNAIDEAITIATVEPFESVDPGQMVGTVKIIPFAVPLRAVEEAERIAVKSPALSITPFAQKRIALISTITPGMKLLLLDKNRAALGARVEPLGSTIDFEERVPHRADELSAAIVRAHKNGDDPILVFGASAITDRRDVVPAAIVQAGGTIEHFGMPVDPGNLLLLGRVHGATVIGLPGCARSPKRNGFDLVLERVLAGVPVSAPDIAAMAIGGLLTEISSRPQPREERASVARAAAIAAVVLAAGLSSRMGHNKLTTTLRGKPLLRHCVEAAFASHVDEV